MAQSEVQIVNSALIKIGEATLTSLDENRKAARVAKRQFPIKRDELLRSYRWNFAIKRASLAPESPAPAFGFANRFLVPTDFLGLIGVFSEDELQSNYTSARIPHVVEGRYILSDENPLLIFYISKVEDPQQFDAQFDEALAWLLARDLAYNLSTGTDMVSFADGGYKEAIKAAKLADAIEGTPEIFEASEWLDSRVDRGYLRIGPVVF